MTRLDQAKDQSTPPEVLIDILGDIRQCAGTENNYEERCWAALNPNLPVSVIEDIALRGSMHFQYMAAANPSMTQVAFDRLIRHEELWGNLVSNPNTPPWFLVRAARGPNSNCLEGAARNVNTPILVLVELAKDRTVGVRVRLARNPSIPEWLVWVLAADEDQFVRGAVAERHRVPLALIERLATDESRGVRLRLQKNKSLSPLTRAWLQGGYGEMSLKDFLEAACSTLT